MSRSEKRNRKRKSLSLQPAEERHGEQQAARYHGGNFSRYVQTLIKRDLASGGALGRPYLEEVAA